MSTRSGGQFVGEAIRASQAYASSQSQATAHDRDDHRSRSLLFRAGNFARTRRRRKQEIEPTRRGAVRMRVCRPDGGVVHRSKHNASPTLASSCAQCVVADTMMRRAGSKASSLRSKMAARHSVGVQRPYANGGRSMSFYRGMTCENVTINGDRGTPITAYVAGPSGPGSFPGVVLIHHLPGWSEFYIEAMRRFAHHGYLAICANLYERKDGVSDGDPDDVAAKARAEGGLADGWGHRRRREVDACAAQSQRQGWCFRLLLRWPARLHLCLPAEGRRCLCGVMGSFVMSIGGNRPIFP